MEPAAHEAMSGGAEDPRPARRDEEAPDQGGQIQRGRLSQEDSGELQQGKAVRFKHETRSRVPVSMSATSSESKLIIKGIVLSF